MHSLSRPSERPVCIYPSILSFELLSDQVCLVAATLRPLGVVVVAVEVYNSERPDSGRSSQRKHRTNMNTLSGNFDRDTEFRFRYRLKALSLLQAV